MTILRRPARGCAALAMLMAIDAHAADLASTFQWPWAQPDVYSDIPAYDWTGGYVAVMGGYNSSTLAQGALASIMVDRAVPVWKYGEQARAQAKASALDMTANGMAYSLHAGINMMSQRLVYGAEIEYGRFAPAMDANSQFSNSRQVDQINTTNAAGQVVSEKISTSLAYTSRAQISDFALLNGRAGYAYGRFMPYALIGLGVTRVKVSATMNASEPHQIYVDNVYSRALSYTVSNPLAVLTKDAYAATVSLGLGVEYAVTDAVLLRAQYNYMTAAAVKGESLSNNMARAGLALKF